MGYQDALTRELAWLATAGDLLPVLAVPNGGPFQIVQAYWPRTVAVNSRGLYVTRFPGSSAQSVRLSAQRRILRHHLRVRMLWPILTAGGQVETEQALFDAAIEAALLRILGPLGNKTHGGRFLAVAEDPDLVTVAALDMEQTLAAGGPMRVDIDYYADDFEVNL